MTAPSSITLERIVLYTTEVADADDAYLVEHLRNLGTRICDHEDAVEFRRRFVGYGRRSKQTMRCPSTWWQHLKLALRLRWPRLFGRLAVRFDEVVLETGALIAGLPDTVKDKAPGGLWIIPYTAEPRSLTFRNAKLFGAVAEGD